jgi:hypothetical protein
MASWPDHLPSGNQKRFWRDPVKRERDMAALWKVGRHLSISGCCDGRIGVMNKIKTIICLIAFGFVSAVSADQHIEVRNMREVKQIFTHFPLGHSTILLSATAQSNERANFYRLTISPAGSVTQIRVMKQAIGHDWSDAVMLKTLVLWKANPSNTTRIVDVKLRPFFEH